MSIYCTYLGKCAQTTPFLHLIVVPNFEIAVSTHAGNAILIVLIMRFPNNLPLVIWTNLSTYMFYSNFSLIAVSCGRISRNYTSDEPDKRLNLIFESSYTAQSIYNEIENHRCMDF